MSGMSFTPTREAGLERLRAFIPHAGAAYAARRNFDFGPDDRSNISLLSPWIRHRMVLEHEILTATLAQHDMRTAEKFIAEVFWRGYFKGWLEHYPGVWTTYCADRDAALAALDRAPALRKAYDRAIAGETGIDAFDAFARELTATGYLHNHARMWFASIWIFTLKLPWTLGADFFLRMLIDGDPASNTLSWRWVGGLHTRGKTYLARADNIAKYTDGRFTPSSLAGSAPALEEDHALASAPLFERLTAAHPTDGVVLLVTEDDMHPESLAPDLRPLAIAGVTAPERRSPLATGQHVEAFADSAMDDALRRAAAHYGCSTERFSGQTIKAFADWVAERGARAVIAPFAPAGPTRMVAEEIKSALSAHDILYTEIIREYDRAVWPHANKGFFKLKKKIPDILHQLDINEAQYTLL